ncbi:MAG TPA: hypothetical protein VF752_10175 [Thermoleophilaceae bacterium]
MRVLAKVAYWVAVVILALALLVALVLFFESRDQSGLSGGVLPLLRL